MFYSIQIIIIVIRKFNGSKNILALNLHLQNVAGNQTFDISHLNVCPEKDKLIYKVSLKGESTR